MDDVLKKLGFKQPACFAVDALPQDLEPLRTAMLQRAPQQDAGHPEVPFILCFVKTPGDVERAARQWAGRLATGGHLWMAYIKKSSPLYKTSAATGEVMDRDSRGWKPLGDAGFEPVMQIALNSDWSALRFKPVDAIKTLKRDPARMLSEAGRMRSGARD